MAVVIAFGFLAFVTNAEAFGGKPDSRALGVGRLHVGPPRAGGRGMEAGRPMPLHLGRRVVDGVRRLVHGAAGEVVSKPAHALGGRAIARVSHVVRDADSLGSQGAADVSRIERAAQSSTRSTVSRLASVPAPVRPAVAELSRRLGQIPAAPMPVLPPPVQQVLALVGSAGSTVVSDVNGLTSWLTSGLTRSLQPLSGLLPVGHLRPISPLPVSASPTVLIADWNSTPMTLGSWPAAGPSGSAPAGPIDLRPGILPTAFASPGSTPFALRSAVVPGGNGNGAALALGVSQGMTGIASAAHGGGAASGLILLLLTLLLVPALWRRLPALTSPRLPVTLAYPLERPG